jgi:hypothetical protein
MIGVQNLVNGGSSGGPLIWDDDDDGSFLGIGMSLAYVPMSSRCEWDAWWCCTGIDLYYRRPSRSHRHLSSICYPTIYRYFLKWCLWRRFSSTWDTSLFGTESTVLSMVCWSCMATSSSEVKDSWATTTLETVRKLGEANVQKDPYSWCIRWLAGNRAGSFTSRWSGTWMDCGSETFISSKFWGIVCLVGQSL